ncbi:MAG: hypothetical protein JJU35_00605 [Balneolales bacterium]|nr:hypothetical protein [Balneolales bacterium]
MKRWIPIAFLALIALFAVANLVLTEMASRALNEAYGETRLVQDGVEVLVRFSDSNISTLSPRIGLERLQVRNLETGDEFRARSLELFVSHGDLWRLIRSRGTGERPIVRNGRLELRDIAVVNAEQEMRYTAGALNATVSGDLFEMYAFVRTDFRNVPSQNQTIRINMNDIRPGTEPLPFIPAELPINRLDRLVLNMNYDQQADAFEVNRFEISLGADRITLDGRLSDVSAISSLGSDAETADTFVRPVLSARMRITPVRPQIPIGNDGLAVHFRSFDATFEGPLVDGLNPQTMLETAFSEISFTIDELSIFPPETFKEIYGQPLGFLGISSDRFTVPGVHAAYRITDDTAFIEEFSLQNPFAEVNLTGQLLRDNNSGLWMWDSSNLLVRPVTPESENFIRMFTSFFELRIQQTEGTFRIPLSGSLQSPRLEGLRM